MIEAVNFLVKKGNRMIGLINGPEKLPASKERHEAYIKALQINKINVDDNLVVHSDLTIDGNNEAMKKLLALKKRPAAIIAFNDYVAMDAIHYAKRQKIRINKDISFVSFANEAICDYMEHPPMASIEQFPYQQGEKATETLLHLLERTEDENEQTFHNILLPSQLIVRVTK
jgi:LacI family transcriptional regulator